MQMWGRERERQTRTGWSGEATVLQWCGYGVAGSNRGLWLRKKGGKQRFGGRMNMEKI